MNVVALAGACLIGLSLGLTGAGGSIITLPVLVYLAGVPPVDAVGLSLFVVGIAALAGALQRIRSGDFHAKAAAMFALSGMAGAVGGARLTPLVPPAVLMGLFAVLMLVVALNMLRKNAEKVAMLPECKPWRLSAGRGRGGFFNGIHRRGRRVPADAGAREICPPAGPHGDRNFAGG